MEMKHGAKMSLDKSIVVFDLVKIISLIICVLLLRLPKCTSKPAVDMYSDRVVSIVLFMIWFYFYFKFKSHAQLPCMMDF